MAIEKNLLGEGHCEFKPVSVDYFVEEVWYPSGRDFQTHSRKSKIFVWCYLRRHHIGHGEGYVHPESQKTKESEVVKKTVEVLKTKDSFA